MRSLPFAAPLAAASLALFAAPLLAQELLLDLPGTNAGDRFGTRVAAGDRLGGDLDGDGASELLVTTLALDPSGASVWSVDVRSGRTGASLRVHYASDQGSAAAFFGAACAFVDDLDGDGVVDYFIDAPDVAAATHDAFLFSGANGKPLQTFALTVSKDQLYARVSPLTDLDGDGKRDLVVSDSGPSGGHFDLVASGSGKVLSTVTSTHLYWGADVAAVADRDGDGLDDVAACDQIWNVRQGSLRIYSSATGAQLVEIKGQVGDLYGASVARLHDLDGDGVDEFMVGTARGYGTVPVAGTVFVYSGATLKILAFVPGEFTGGRFGVHCADAGDVNGDGITDLAIGAPNVPTWVSSGPCYLFSGRTFGRLYRFDLPDTMQWSDEALVGASDLDGDGFGDLALGDPESLAMPALPGRVRVFGGNDLHLSITPHVAVANQLVALDVGEGTTIQLVMTALIDLNGTPLFAMLDLAFFDADGDYELADTIPPGLAGSVATFQCFAQKAPRGTRASAPEVLTLQ